jgi:hypothetical protein
MSLITAAVFGKAGTGFIFRKCEFNIKWCIVTLPSIKVMTG